MNFSVILVVFTNAYTEKVSEEKEIVKDLSLSVDSGKCVVITGPNGGGKSTMAKLIAGIEKPTSGRILLDGEDITEMGITERAQRGIGYAFQQPVRFKGIEVIDLLRIASGDKKMTIDKACSYLSEVGLCAQNYVRREVNASLSGGELKRIEIATVLARGSRMSVFDEPEAGIDLWSFQNLIRVFEHLQNQNREGSILIISHQERILAIADEIIVLTAGKVSSHGPREEILPTLLGTASVASACDRLEKKEGVQ